MAKKTLKRQMKEIEERNSKRFKYHLEMMCAAYIKQTNIPADQACLKVQTEKDETGKEVSIKYYFEKYERTETADVKNLHPDIEHLFHLAYGILKAHDEKDEASLTDGYDMLRMFMLKYAESLGESEVVPKTQNIPRL